MVLSTKSWTQGLIDGQIPQFPMFDEQNHPFSQGLLGKYGRVAGFLSANLAKRSKGRQMARSAARREIDMAKRNKQEIWRVNGILIINHYLKKKT